MDGEFRIGRWLVQPSLNLISQNGASARVEPKVMQVLVCLAKRAGEPVAREELIQTVWPDTFVTDDALKRCIGELRRVFEDDAREPRLIETIPKRGYRLLVQVDEIEPASPNRVKPAEAIEETAAQNREAAILHPKTRAPKLWLQYGAACLLLLVCATFAYMQGRKSAVLPPPSFHRLTFERGIIYSARFGPDNQVVYDASWDNKPVRIFTTHSGIPQALPLDIVSAHLLGVSPKGELALSLKGYTFSFPIFLNGTLARAPISGGAPRELLEDVRWADFDRNGELAVVHHANGKSRLEYPMGKVLYETAGWISDARFSPQDDRIAFADHPSWNEDRGSIVVVDLETEKKTTLSTGWESARGLAWSASGEEVWFTAAKSGERRDLYAVDLRGRQRALLRVPGGITLHDISSDGRALLTVDNERNGTMVLSAAGERDISWSDIGSPIAISPDGKQVLLEDESESAGPDYLVGLRGIDGSPPVRLGEGWGGNFSPDGKWTATNIPSIPESTFLLPIGVGQRRELRHPGVRSSLAVHFMPDGQSILFFGTEAGHLARGYIQNLNGGPPRPLTPDGVIAGFPSPDGRYLAAMQPDGTRATFDIQRREFCAIPQGVTKQLMPIGWSADSRYLYLFTQTSPPSQIWEFDVAGNTERVVRQLSPADPAGILEIFNVQMTQDRKTFVYGYDRYLSELYIVDNIR